MGGMGHIWGKADRPKQDKATQSNTKHTRLTREEQHDVERGDDEHGHARAKGGEGDAEGRAVGAGRARACPAGLRGGRGEGHGPGGGREEEKEEERKKNTGEGYERKAEREDILSEGIYYNQHTPSTHTQRDTHLALQMSPMRCTVVT